MDTNDYEEYDLPKYQLSTTGDEENNETEDPIAKTKPPPSSAEQMGKALP